MVNPYTAPGQAAWKFVHTGRIVYRNSHSSALKYFYQVRDVEEVAVYARTRKGWEYVFTSQPREKCNCGREYTDTPSGEPFRWQDPNKFIQTTQDVISIMKSPVQCMVCYYQGELEKGRWAPRYVKKELGLD